MKAFKQWRKQNNLSIEDIFEKTRIHVATLQKWDGGKVKPSDLAKQVLRRFFPDCPIAK